jgi:hypothetical protein
VKIRVERSYFLEVFVGLFVRGKAVQPFPELAFIVFLDDFDLKFGLTRGYRGLQAFFPLRMSSQCGINSIF